MKSPYFERVNATFQKQGYRVEVNFSLQHFYTDKNGVVHLRIKARSNAWHIDDCPFCGRRCPGYDHPAMNRKGAAYTIGKAPEHLTENQKIRLDMIQANDPQLFRAYRLKESLRLLLKLTHAKQAEDNLKRWLWWASHSRIQTFKDLYRKIRRHRERLLPSIISLQHTFRFPMMCSVCSDSRMKIISQRRKKRRSAERREPKESTSNIRKVQTM